ncbi:MAG: hypothetical protein ABSE51_20895 [Terracidiphilus sp.]|jgi:hypothetical protein
MKRLVTRVVESVLRLTSTGLVSALTFCVLGLQPDAASRGTCHVVPLPGDLTHTDRNVFVVPGEMVYKHFDVPGISNFHAAASYGLHRRHEPTPGN